MVLHHVSFIISFHFKNVWYGLNIHSMIITIGFYLLMVFTLDMYFLSAYVDVTLVENSHELIRVRLFWCLTVLSTPIQCQSVLLIRMPFDKIIIKPQNHWLNNRSTIVGTATEFVWMMAQIAQSCCNMGPKS